MKKLLVACVVGLAALAPATASAASSSTTEGKTVSYAAGKLEVKTKKGTFTYLVGKTTDCGYSTGQMGGEIRCADLKQKKYAGQAVTVKWHLEGKKRVAELVAVHLK